MASGETMGSVPASPECNQVECTTMDVNEKIAGFMTEAGILDAASKRHKVPAKPAAKSVKKQMATGKKALKSMGKALNKKAAAPAAKAGPRDMVLKGQNDATKAAARFAKKAKQHKADAVAAKPKSTRISKHHIKAAEHAASAATHYNAAAKHFAKGNHSKGIAMMNTAREHAKAYRTHMKPEGPIRSPAPKPASSGNKHVDAYKAAKEAHGAHAKKAADTAAQIKALQKQHAAHVKAAGVAKKAAEGHKAKADAAVAAAKAKKVPKKK